MDYENFLLKIIVEIKKFVGFIINWSKYCAAKLTTISESMHNYTSESSVFIPI